MAAGDGGVLQAQVGGEGAPEADDVALERDDGDVPAVLHGEVGAGRQSRDVERAGAHGVIEDGQRRGGLRRGLRERRRGLDRGGVHGRIIRLRDEAQVKDL